MIFKSTRFVSVAAGALLLLGVAGASAQTTLTMSSWVPPNHAISIALGEWGQTPGPVDEGVRADTTRPAFSMRSR